jgi:hypothetical protein
VRGDRAHHGCHLYVRRVPAARWMALRMR